jgi:hypothetical protein
LKNIRISRLIQNSSEIALSPKLSKKLPEPYLISYLVLSTLKAVVAVFPFTVISNATMCIF